MNDPVSREFDLWLHAESLGDSAFVAGYICGAGVMAALLGMAHAIRATYLCPECGCWEGNVTRRGWGCQCTNDE